MKNQNDISTYVLDDKDMFKESKIIDKKHDPIDNQIQKAKTIENEALLVYPSIPPPQPKENGYIIYIALKEQIQNIQLQNLLSEYFIFEKKDQVLDFKIESIIPEKFSLFLYKLYYNSKNNFCKKFNQNVSKAIKNDDTPRICPNFYTFNQEKELTYKLLEYESYMKDLRSKIIRIE